MSRRWMGSSRSSSFCKNKQNKKLLAKRETTHLENFLEKEKRREETTHLENFLEKEKSLLEKILGKRDDPFVVS
jgi:hypothetical protein